jgi:cell division transport system permease protein
MRLVGATDAYVRRPFLIEGFIKGVLGGVLALGLTWLAIHAVSNYLSFQTVFFDQRLAIFGLAGGALMGLLGSAFSVGRHLRRV